MSSRARLLNIVILESWEAIKSANKLKNGVRFLK